jgi:putative methyltransferase (TIGR04325 family)
MQALTRLPVLGSQTARVRKWPLVRQGVNFAAGHNRVFPDLPAAKAFAERYSQYGHESAENVGGLRTALATTRPSDYPVLFHLARLPLEGLRLFDLGGTMGNLLYLYDRYLNFPTSLRWTVHDLPRQMERGRVFARQQGESRLQFTDDILAASSHHVLLVSGALHYLDFALGDYVAGMSQPPRHVIVNRTPLVDAPTAATVQYTPGVVMVPCRLLNRKELVSGMERAGYRLVDSWRVPELSISLPFDPEYWVREYTGLYFRAEDETGPKRPYLGPMLTPGT